MKRPSRSRIPPKALGWHWFFLFGALFLALTLPRVWTDSLVNDEAWEVTNGYAYLTQGETRTGPDYIHPPLLPALHALPLLAVPLRPLAPGMDGQNRAWVFTYLNRDETRGFVTAAPRLVSILLGLLVGLMLFTVTRREHPAVCLTTLVLWVFEPNFLAWAVPAKTDSGTVALALVGVWLFDRALQKPVPSRDFLAGAALGAVLTAKLTLLVVPPALFLADLLTPSRPGERLARWRRVTVSALAWIFLLYSPALIRTGNPLQPLLDYGHTWASLLRLSGLCIPTFLLGHCFPQPPFWAFPVVAVLKLPLPVTLILMGSAALALRGEIKIRWVWALPALALWGTLLVAHQSPFRYALPALALGWPTVGQAVARLWERPFLGKGSRVWILGLGLWFVGGTLAQWDRPLGFVAVPVSPARRTELVGDYNLDAGQDFRRLADRAKARGWTTLKLADSTMSEPCFDGVPWESWTQRDAQAPQPGNVYVMGASFLQSASAAYPETAPLTRGWPSRTPPTEWVGDTLRVWVIPGERTPDPSPTLPSRPYFKYRTPPCAAATGPATP